jgi:ribonucleoside-diphosphate reductase alpha chain
MQDTIYETFISKSRYARYLEIEQRRENWTESVDRYFTFMEEHLLEQYDYLVDLDKIEALKQLVKDKEILPSMRSIMTAGEALERDNTAGYNCSYLPVDNPVAFDEAMFILLCGTGVGFSVERQYVNQLPEVPSRIYPSDTFIVVHDSKEGWAKSLRQLVALLYSGEAAKWDVSNVRRAGERLKTFGGRASGPAPLEDLFRFVTRIFKGAQGRKLTSLECHDIMCKIGEVVVVGGVRRSAMISLSNLSDDRMRHAKSGAWWEQNGQRALANNSACYTERPDVGVFMQEWLSLYESKSGERGIFNREAAKKIAAKNGRRDINYDFGTNPCSEIILRPYQFCNLSTVIVRANDTVEYLTYKSKMAAILGTWQSTLTNFPYLRKVWETNTKEERLLGVSMTGILDNHLFNDPEDKELPGRLEAIRDSAIASNADEATLIGINASVAVTAIKPEGTTSQLTDSASGMHTRHSEFYIRRIRGDVKDPLTQFMIKAGVPAEPCVMKPDTTVVFSFAKKAPHGALVREDLTAIEHLKLWLLFQRHYCEHKPSVTISVSEKEWPAVGAFVWEYFDEMSGVSFLPYDGGSYRQAPYEECTEEEYLALLAKIPADVDWDALVEETDNVEGTQTLACSANGCEIQ